MKRLKAEGIEPSAFNTGICLVCEVFAEDNEAINRTQRLRRRVRSLVRVTITKGHPVTSVLSAKWRIPLVVSIASYEKVKSRGHRALGF